MTSTRSKPEGYAEWSAEVREAFDSGLGRRTLLDFIMRHADEELLRLHAGEALLAAMAEDDARRLARWPN